MAAFVALLLAAPVAAQDGFGLTGPGVLDRAGVMAPADAALVDERLKALDADHGIQMAVLTQSVRDVKTSPEDFATQKFNDWAIGDGVAQDGILLLMLPSERFVRIELGAGYPAEAGLTAQDIISRTFLPRAADDPGAALRDTALATIDRIALPRAGVETGLPAAVAAPAPRSTPVERSGGLGWLVPAIFFGGIASLIGLSVIRRRTGTPTRACPQCGGTSLEALALSEPAPGGETLTRHMARCASCGWTGPDPAPPRPQASAPPTAERRDPRPGPGGSSGGNFGGGQSKGGGASGRW